jgi:hypothetical protein
MWKKKASKIRVICDTLSYDNCIKDIRQEIVGAKDQKGLMCAGGRLQW